MDGCKVVYLWRELSPSYCALTFVRGPSARRATERLELGRERRGEERRGGRVTE